MQAASDLCAPPGHKKRSSWLYAGVPGRALGTSGGHSSDTPRGSFNPPSESRGRCSLRLQARERSCHVGSDAGGPKASASLETNQQNSQPAGCQGRWEEIRFRPRSHTRRSAVVTFLSLGFKTQTGTGTWRSVKAPACVHCVLSQLMVQAPAMEQEPWTSRRLGRVVTTETPQCVVQVSVANLNL